MAILRVQGSVHTDPDVRDGYVEIYPGDDGLEYVFMAPATYGALTAHGILGMALDACRALGTGQHLIPRSVISFARRREVEQRLTYLDPGESDTCCLPTCLQDAVSFERGYPLCVGHAAEHADWDSLTA